MKSNIVILEDESQCCLFNVETYDLFSIPEFTQEVLSHYFENLDIDSTCQQFSISKDNLESLLDQIGFKADYKLNNTKTIVGKRRRLQRITLHIANDCNLRCKYCYADGGSYKSTRQLMSKETAIRFVDFCAENYESIGNIVFFGGEPFLNYPIIKLVCELFHEKYDKGEISFLPKFGAITNGTVYNDTIFNLIKTYLSFITVSVDGPKEINDTNRIRTNGKGSFDAIDVFLRKLTEMSGLKVMVESTYTRQHIAQGYSRKMIEDFFKNTYNINSDVIDELAIDDEELRNKKVGKDSIGPWFPSILSSVVHKKPQTKCDVVRSIYAVSTDGYIYPCHMNIGDGMKAISSIWESNDGTVEIINERSTFNLKANDTCNDCWAANFCGGCARAWYFNTEKLDFFDIPGAERCRRLKKIAKFALLKICEIRQDASQWQKLLERNKINS